MLEVIAAVGAGVGVAGFIYNKLSSSKIKVGDLVCLKSDPRPMTVESFDNEHVSVVWRDQAGTLRRDALPYSMLKSSE